MDPTEYDGIESYVAEMTSPQSNRLTEWFPKEMALCQNQDDHDKGSEL